MTAALPTRTAALSDARIVERGEDGTVLPMLVWAPGPGWRMLSSAVLGGGWDERHWVVNAQVRGGYRRMDTYRHLSTIAAEAGLRGPGVGLMTAASVRDVRRAAEEGAEALVTAGVGVHGWAATTGPSTAGPPPAGTINIIAALPVPLSPAAYVNAVATATEAKVQALLDAGLDASGTPTDAVCVAAPVAGDGQVEEMFMGPRSVWGARLARTVHAATYQACLHDRVTRERERDERRAPVR
ncbi:adenosylcobinamide amidohydrolase [Streptomyces gobiensis]|uniref:adenosylcobinamide amidohydrolase n=1 Tax=Streptomyces gobiensis TaxID=2875706 RepID=UPI001E4449ED|nr:adenosylcobinamide amidohydrolase [Streptomyces gobiensis]UGY91926.1 adenosylcobinamide amidohydrolase [Streptomyces gobiensis]